MLSNGNINKLNLDGNKSRTHQHELNSEETFGMSFHQMFYEAWGANGTKLLRWKISWPGLVKTKLYYQQFYPISITGLTLESCWMFHVCELNRSHQALVPREDEQVRLTNQTMETGILFESGDPYKVKSILLNAHQQTKIYSDNKWRTNWSKVNGESIDPGIDRTSILRCHQPGQRISIEF